MGVVRRIADDLKKDGFGPDRIAIFGFSQGACLALEYAARAGRPFACVAGLSDGLLGTGDGDGAPQSGLNDQDPHFPLARVRTSEKVFGDLGAEVTTRIYPGAGYGIVEDEISTLLSILNTSCQ